jgi:hypothetical protein
MRMRLGGGREHAAPAAGLMGRHPDRAANARIAASSTWSHWCGPGAGFPAGDVGRPVATVRIPVCPGVVEPTAATKPFHR